MSQTRLKVLDPECLECSAIHTASVLLVETTSTIRFSQKDEARALTFRCYAEAFPFALEVVSIISAPSLCSNIHYFAHSLDVLATTAALASSE
jgi:hypothetical protein